MQRLSKKKCQVIITTHSYDILTDKGIAGEEALLLMPSEKGTTVTAVSTDPQMAAELEAGFSIADCVMQVTAPQNIEKIMDISL